MIKFYINYINMYILDKYVIIIRLSSGDILQTSALYNCAACGKTYQVKIFLGSLIKFVLDIYININIIFIINYLLKHLEFRNKKIRKVKNTNFN